MKKQMTVRVEEETLHKLSIMATESGITRQELVERIILDATDDVLIELNDESIPCVPSNVIETIRSTSSSLQKGSEVSLKKLVGDTLWSELTDSTRRVFGKEFKDLVLAGQFRNLQVGRKKSNNEQQYLVCEYED